jgi:hypothetical protein
MTITVRSIPLETEGIALTKTIKLAFLFSLFRNLPDTTKIPVKYNSALGLNNWDSDKSDEITIVVEMAILEWRNRELDEKTCVKNTSESRLNNCDSDKSAEIKNRVGPPNSFDTEIPESANSELNGKVCVKTNSELGYSVAT